MTPATRSHSVVATGLLVFLTACSVTDYKVPVSDFAQATQDSEQALVILNQQVTDAYAAVQRGRVLERQKLVVAYETVDAEGKRSDDCLTASERCRLITVDQDHGQQELLSPDPPLREMIILMGAIRSYADGLAAIVNAATAQSVATQVNATLGSIQDLSETIAKLKEPKPPEKPTRNPVPEFTTPVANAVNWIFGQYIASVQLDGLKNATKAAKPVIADAANLFGDAADIGSDIPRVSLAGSVATRIDALDDNLSESALQQLIESAAAYDQFLLAEPPGVFLRLREAHDSLADKLQEQNLSMADVMAKIKAFLREAETLKNIVQALAAAGEPKPEG